jgi:microcystin-dependent protein
MTQPFVGEIKAFGFNFNPTRWALCQGQLLPISSNTALFSILGTTYGGNGTTNFGLPDLRGRIPMGNGNGAGLSPRVLGEESGTETVTVLSTEMASHNHSAGSKNDPGGDSSYTNVPATGLIMSHYVFEPGSEGSAYAATLNPGATTLHPLALTFTGGSLPHQNLQPLLCINWCIATQGIFPQRG